MIIKTVFVSSDDNRITNGLNRMGIKTVPVINNPQLDAPVSCHADCAAFRIGNLIFAERENADVLVKTGLDIIAVDNISSPYPNDVKLNAKLFGKKILCNAKYVSEKISVFAQQNGYTLLHCNQGYAACSTVKLNDSTAITDDETVFNALTQSGIECLLVSKGSVNLKSYDYGFIGGCCGMIDKNTIAFAGSLDSHSDAESIRNFLISKSIDIIELFEGKLVDFGGFVELE